jgi:hypothetical protein
MKTKAIGVLRFSPKSVKRVSKNVYSITVDDSCIRELSNEKLKLVEHTMFMTPPAGSSVLLHVHPMPKRKNGVSTGTFVNAHKIRVNLQHAMAEQPSPNACLKDAHVIAKPIMCGYDASSASFVTVTQQKPKYKKFNWKSVKPETFAAIEKALFVIWSMGYEFSELPHDTVFINEASGFAVEFHDLSQLLSFGHASQWKMERYIEARPTPPMPPMSQTQTGNSRKTTQQQPRLETLYMSNAAADAKELRKMFDKLPPPKDAAKRQYLVDTARVQLWSC